MYPPADPTDGNPAPVRPAPRHRAARTLPAPATLGLTVTAVLAAFGIGAALLPSGLTGSGTEAESPAAAVAALAPGAGGGAPGATAVPSSAAPAPSSAAPSRSARRTSAPATRKAVPKRTATSRPTATAQPRRTTAAPAAAAGQSGPEAEVVRLTNVEREKAGCGSVRSDGRLRTAMRLHAAEVGEHAFPYLSHDSDDGRNFVARAREQGYGAAGGENIARGQRSAADVMDSWMKSDGHRANILNCGFKAIGVARVEANDGTLVWGQLFGRS